VVPEKSDSHAEERRKDEETGVEVEDAAAVRAPVRPHDGRDPLLEVVVGLRRGLPLVRGWEGMPSKNRAISLALA